jgi:radical SAM protein (TIGR01212 family)
MDVISENKQSRKLWLDKPYHSLDYDMKTTFGEKLYRITLNAGLTCPNRDGTLGHNGCIFCSLKGSGDFAGEAHLSIAEQLIKGKSSLASKRGVNSYIAYFQAFTNTYGDLHTLEQLYLEAIQDEEVKILSIATRPDCLEKDILALIGRINMIKPVWIELGLQTIHESTASYIRRGYPLAIFEEKVKELQNMGIPVITHVILALPGETKEMMLETIDYLNRLKVAGIKLSLLHVLKDTDLAIDYENNPFWIPTLAEYLELLGECLMRLDPNITIHRLTGDGPKDILIAPLWTHSKRMVLNELHRYLRKHNIWQGKKYCERMELS